MKMRRLRASRSFLVAEMTAEENLSPFLWLELRLLPSNGHRVKKSGLPSMVGIPHLIRISSMPLRKSRLKNFEPCSVLGRWLRSSL